jgi:hypothetical protein
MGYNRDTSKRPRAAESMGILQGPAANKLHAIRAAARQPR